MRQIWANTDSRKIFVFLCVNLMFMVVELCYGIWTNSLGLISDACRIFFFIYAQLSFSSLARFVYNIHERASEKAFNFIFFALCKIRKKKEQKKKEYAC